MEVVNSGLFHLIVTAITIIATPLSVFLYNPRYLYSQTGYADGGDMYSHIVEAVHLKELLRNGTTDFWFEKVSLGYPMFTAYQPLPCFFIANVMLIFESILSPLLVFRLIFLTVLSLVPFAFYKSSRLFGMRSIHGIIICLLSFAVQSWRKFGLEISAFIEYGLLTQAFGMLLLPLAVSSCYNWIFLADMDKKSSKLPFLTLAVIFLSNFFFGLYACILSAVMFSIKLASIRNTASLKSILKLMQRFVGVHLSWVLLISWWILSCLIGYRYIGGLPWRSESEDGYPVSFLYNKLINGDIFDHGRSFPLLTVLVLFGFITSNLKIAHLNIPFVSCTREDRTFSCWLVLSSLISVVLFLGRTTFSVLYDLIPFHAELETVKYLNAVHFCGILLASSVLTDTVHAISRLVCHIVQSSSQTSLFVSTFQVFDNWHKMFGVLRSQPSKEPKVNKSGVHTCMSYIDSIVKSLLVLFIAIPLWCNQFSTIGSQLTMTEVSSNFTRSLQSLRKNPTNGRLLGHKALGTARSWDLALIPVFTGKPGLMTYSRGYHDSLSIFYLESLSFNPEKTQLFTSMLRLYNVHFLMTSWIELDPAFVKACNMKHLMTIEDLVFYELLSEDSDYGYFDFVRIPGRIQGDLKQIRETVLKTFEFYIVNSILKINPSTIDTSNDDVIIDVNKSSWLDRVSENSVQVTWKWKGLENDSQVIMGGFVKENSWKWIYSQVIEEKTDGTSYQAIVHVAESSENTQDSEHLLLKVTYHPFWKCFYYPVSDDFALSNVKQPYFLDGKQYLTVNHVTPNLMSVSLPSGRYLVVFTYRFPGILKILAFICVVCGLRIFVDYLQRKWTSQTQSTTMSEIQRKFGVSNRSHSSVRRELIFSENGNVVDKMSNSELKMSNTEAKGGNAESQMSNTESQTSNSGSKVGNTESKVHNIESKVGNAESKIRNSESKRNLESLGFDDTGRAKRPSDDKEEPNIDLEKSSLNVINVLKSLKYEHGDAVSDTTSWNVKGRLRSYSIAAGTRFNADTMRFLSRSPENRNMENVLKRLKTASTDNSSVREGGNRNSIYNHREISSEKSSSDDSSDSRSSRSLIMDDSVIDSNQVGAEKDAGSDNAWPESDDNEGDIDNHNAIVSAENNSNYDGWNEHDDNDDDQDNRCGDHAEKDAGSDNASPENDDNDVGSDDPYVDHTGKGDSNDDGGHKNDDNDDYNSNCKGGRFERNFNRESSNDSNNHGDRDNDESVLNLKDRLAKLDDSSNFEEEDNYSGMVKQLRKTYIRQRRNTLSALPAFKK